jgi:type I restriction enzyme R subunit
LFGFTGTPIFPENATYNEINGEEKTLKILSPQFFKIVQMMTFAYLELEVENQH